MTDSKQLPSTVNVGEELIEILCLLVEADQPFLLNGPSGIGKSQIIEEVAKRLGIGSIVRDLSIMEPPDLAGIPHIEQGRTRMCPPDFLPRKGKGLFFLEELNRAPRHMRAPCLQLLTARSLNDYFLPDGWLPCAAINPGGGDYDVDDLDPALLYRFVKIFVMPNVDSWLTWARNVSLHQSVIRFVESAPDVFSDPQANPRAWTKVSSILNAWEAGATNNQNYLAACLAGTVGEEWAVSFLSCYLDDPQPLTPQQIIEAYPMHRTRMLNWKNNGQLDRMKSSLQRLQRFIQPQRSYQKVMADPVQKANLQRFVADLTADLRTAMRSWLEDRGFDSSVP